MRFHNTNILKKTVKISVLTCAALGGAALIASGAAVKALTEGAGFLKNTVQDILHEETEAAADSVADVAVEEIVEAEPVIAAESCDRE